jgi:hypothetical protein
MCSNPLVAFLLLFGIALFLIIYGTQVAIIACSLEEGGFKPKTKTELYSSFIPFYGFLVFFSKYMDKEGSK